MNIGNNIAKYRRFHGKSQSDLGEALGVHRNTIWNYENRDGITALRLWQVSEELGEPIERFFE